MGAVQAAGEGVGPSDGSGHHGSNGATPLLEVSSLSISTGGNSATTIVDDVDLSIGRAECVAIAGESGSGKSMTLKALLRLLPSTLERSGQILLDGEPIEELSDVQMRRVRGLHIGLVPQDPFTSLNPVRRIGAQFADVLRAHAHHNRSEIRETALGLINAVGLSDPERRLRQFPHELSGGMRQRLVIALSLACEPSVVLADEPTTALDVTVQAQIMNLLESLRDSRGVSLVLVTHDLGVIREHAERVVVMYAGQVMESGPTDEVLSAPRSPYTESLLASVPTLHGTDSGDLPELPGGPADPNRHGTGCRFRQRCPRVQPQCESETPQLDPVSQDHSVRCFNPVPTPTRKST